MGEIIVGAAAIISAVVSAASAVAAVVAAIVSAAVAAATAVVTAVAAALAGVVSAISGAIATAYSAIAGWVSAAISAITEVVTVAWEFIGYYTLTIEEAFAAFLEAIYFDVILTVHEIAYIVSEDYREMITGVFREVSKASMALGFAPEVLNLAFRNARNMVLSASALMGKSYDLAEITWLSSFNDYMKTFQKVATKYKDRPDLLFYDLDRYLIKPSTDTFADVSKTVLRTLDDTIGTVKLTLEKINEFRTDIDKFVAQLPSTVRKEVEPMLEKVTKVFDDFTDYTYEPKMKLLDGIMAALSFKQERDREGIKGLVDRLKRPGDMLEEVERLTYGERLEQEKKIGDVASRSYTREIEEWEETVTPQQKGFLRLIELLKLRLPPPEYAVAEITTPSRPADVPVKPRVTWFVGDF